MPHCARGWCWKHYGRWRTHGDPLHVRPPAAPRKAVNGGYVMVKAPPGHPNAMCNGKIAQHRLVMSQHLDRALHPGESVHHKNGNRKDNRLSNLELRARSHGPGADIPELVAHAVETLMRYAPQLVSREADLYDIN